VNFLILIFQQHSAKTGEGHSVFGHYSDLESWPFQYIGVTVFLFITSVFVYGIVSPNAFYVLSSVDEKDLCNSDKVIAQQDGYVEMSSAGVSA
jgi:hypothetical protein